ncbi:MAG: hypothetical protein OEZ10_07375 [Gammaproteobacteria bacterium]|nr:hypothetical protein [Gammaproteobacteria bacterium]
MEDRRRDRTPITELALGKQLEHVAEEGGFSDVVVATHDGLMLAEAATHGRGEQLAAMAGSLWEMRHTLTQKGCPNDITVHRMLREDGSCISARFFSYMDQDLVLMLTSPPDANEKAYIERLSNGIQRILYEVSDEIVKADDGRDKFRS